jgi:hypothetical protein
MITDKKLMEIIEKLLAKAKSDQVHWQGEASKYVGHQEADQLRFVVHFKESKLYIQYSSPPTEPDEIEIGIENNDGDTLKTISAYEDDENENERWRLFLDLYQEAERSVLGSDRVLSEIEQELQKDGAIGLS